MKALLHELETAVLAAMGLIVLLCGIYPLLVWGLAEALFPRQANGSLIRGAGGTVAGSRLLAQPFTAERYFHPRPSAAGNGYDATDSGGSNLGPLSAKLDSLIRVRAANYRAENHLSATVWIPADAVTASASGLDPHISMANARLQMPRVARARRLPEATVERLVREHTEHSQWGFLGEPRLNVLELNIALDRIP